MQFFMRVAGWCITALILTVCVPPASAQQTPPATPRDSVYEARMNAGYQALRDGDTTSAIAAFTSAAEAAPSLATPRLQLGYTLLAVGRASEAALRFEQALVRDPDLDMARRQVGYIYARLGRNDEALVAFTYLRDAGRAAPRDYVAIGNLASMLRDRGAAENAFRAALATRDTAVAADASAGLRGLLQDGSGAGLFGELYVAPFYQDRFDNTVGIGFLRAGVRGGGWLRPSVYGSLRATRDSRSTGGLQPILFNDNTVIPAVGVRVQPGGVGLTLYAEAGAAYPLVDAVDPAWERDLRAGVNYAFAHQQPLASARGPLLITELSGDATYYDRFDQNVIAFGQWRQSLRLWHRDGFAVDVFGRAWSAYDSRGEYFNRVVEGGGGAAVHVGRGALRTSVYFDVLRGRYLERPPVGVIPGGLPRNYDDWRVTVVFGAFRLFPFATQ